MTGDRQAVTGARATLATEFAAAAAAIELLARGRRLPEGLELAAERFRLPRASRGPLRDIASTAVRLLGRTRALARQLNRKPPAPPLAALQQVALAQLLQTEEAAVDAEQGPPAGAAIATAPVTASGAAAASAPATPAGEAAASAAAGPPGRDPHRPRHAAVIVDQAVAAARLLPSAAGTAPSPAAAAAAASFINATLRRFLRERNVLLAAIADDPEAQWNFPRWWLQELTRDYPRDWQAILLASDQPAPLTLRVNRRRTTVESLKARFEAAGLAGVIAGPLALRLARGTDVTRLPGFEQGLFSVQDAGAQLAVPLLDVADGQRVLDACAAPGGKTAHLLETADCELTALDVDGSRLARVRENLARLGLSADVRQGDARRPADWWDGRPYDRILLDAPCSASGIVRRHPDVRWLRRRSDLATLSATQAELLAALWPLLKPGGKLLYATCSVFRTENDQSIDRFLRTCGDCRRVPLNWHGQPGGASQPVSQLLPRASPSGAAGDTSDHDGFYYALLQKPP